MHQASQPLIQKVAYLSGWAQKPESLLSLLENFSTFEIRNLQYNQYGRVEEFFAAVKKTNYQPDILIGWSLGGQLAVRLIAQQIFRPKLLILLSAPFQFVKTPIFRDNSLKNPQIYKIPAAMPIKAFQEFRDNFHRAKDKTLKKFSIMMTLNDSSSKYLLDNLQLEQDNQDNLNFWLDELGEFSAYDLDLQNFPRTLIFHGAKDVIVHYLQSEIFQQHLKNSRLEIFPDSGHVLHLSNKNEITKIIAQELDNGIFLRDNHDCPSKQECD